MFERKYQEYGLVDVHQFDNSIVVDLKYGTTENFMGEIMYENSKLAYLEKDLALAIANGFTRRKVVVYCCFQFINVGHRT